MFFINHTELGNEFTALMEIEGPLNSETSSDLETYIRKIVNNQIKFLIIDFKNISFLSSEGIGITLLIQKIISEKDGFMVFFNLTDEIQNLFKILGFDKLFTVSDSREEAVAILDRQIEMRSGRETTTQFPEEKTIIEESEPVSNPFFADHPTFPDEADTSFYDNEIEDNDQDYTENMPAPEFESFIIKCASCDSAIRINEPGDHVCPECSTKFSVPESGKAIFKN